MAKEQFNFIFKQMKDKGTMLLIGYKKQDKTLILLPQYTGRRKRLFPPEPAKDAKKKLTLFLKNK